MQGVRLYRAELCCQLWQQLRAPAQFLSIPFGVTWPYALVLLPGGALDAFDFGPIMLVLFGTLGTLNLGVFGLGMRALRERAQGWLRLKQASPMRPVAHFAAQLSVTLFAALLLALALTTIAVLAGHLPLSGAWRVVALITLGVIPFGALGLALAYAAKPSAAESLIAQVVLALVALALLPAFGALPEALRRALEALNWLSPVYHFSHLAFAPLLESPWPNWLHALALALLSAGLIAVTVVLYRRDEGGSYV